MSHHVRLLAVAMAPNVSLLAESGAATCLLPACCLLPAREPADRRAAAPPTGPPSARRRATCPRRLCCHVTVARLCDK
jgi:hypothetical protein